MNQHILPTKLLLMNCQTGSSNKIYLEDISRGNKVVTTRSNNQFFNNNKYSYYYGSKLERRTWHSPHSSSPTSLTNLCIKDSNWLEAKKWKKEILYRNVWLSKSTKYAFLGFFMMTFLFIDYVSSEQTE